MSRARWVAAGAALLLIAYLLALQHYRVPGWQHYRAPAAGAGPVLDPVFLRQQAPVEARYGALFDYFAQGFAANASPAFEHVNYSGAGSFNGYQVSGLEGYARTAPLLAAWVYGGRPDRAAGTAPRLTDMLRSGLLAGTAAGSAGYWGDIGDYDQRIVEAADIARVLWLTRAQIWDRLNPAERRQIATWLGGALRAKVHPNNWQFFPVMVALTLRQLYDPAQTVPWALYDNFKRGYRGHGWFTDAPEGIDYYNAWGISYELLWLRLLAPEHDRVFIDTALAASAEVVAHLISPQGIPMMGRSTCYRTAIPSPLVGRALLSGDAADAGVGRRALDRVWTYFVARGALIDGHLSQGYFGDDLRLVEAYTGPGSCHWGLRSLVLAYMQPPDGPFWRAPEAPLPVELADFRLPLPELGWELRGERASGEITLEIAANTAPVPPLQAYGLRHRLDEALTWRPRRPYNHAQKYQRHSYPARQPYLQQP